jgi:hypothetical protein
MSKDQIYRVSDGSNGSTTPPEDERLREDAYTDWGSTQTDKRTQQVAPTGDDPYGDWGGTAAERPQAAPAEAYTGGTRVTLKRGDTFWKLAEEKYDGKHPIEAIYAANGLYPKVNEKNGKLEMVDPTYYAGKTYIMPDAKDVERLTQQYRQRVEELGKHDRSRVGEANEETSVKLIYGDRFEKLAQAKYGKQMPMEAIYEANGLRARVTTGADGQQHIKEPMYYAGRTYKLPAEQDIPELVRRFNDNNRPVAQQEQPQGNYGDYGEPTRRQPVVGNGQITSPEADRQREHVSEEEIRRQRQMDYDTGYQDGYEQGTIDTRNQGCGCGGGGCERCSGRRREVQVEVNQGCYMCGGGGCEACMGPQWRSRRCGCNGAGCESCGGRRRRDNVCQGCGGGGCEACVPNYRSRMCGCNGAGCESCTGIRRTRDTCQGCGGGGCEACMGPRWRSRFCGCNGAGCQNCMGSGRRNDRGCRGCGGGGCEACMGPRWRSRFCQCNGAGCEACGGRRRNRGGCYNCGGGGCESCLGPDYRSRYCQCNGAGCNSCRGKGGFGVTIGPGGVSVRVNIPTKRNGGW